MTEIDSSDADLKALTAQLFGAHPDTARDLATPDPPRSVTSEGGNPAPGPIPYEEYLRDYSRRLFDRGYASYQQLPPE